MMKFKVADKLKDKETGKTLAIGAMLVVLSACLPHEVGDGDGDSHLSIDRSEANLSAQELYDISQQIGSFLTERFKLAESRLDPKYASCSNPDQMTEHAYALLAFGREQECLQVISNCMNQVSGQAKGKIAFAGGQCAWKAGNYGQAYELFRESTKRDLYGGDAEYSARVFEFARFVEIVGFTAEGRFSPERTAKDIFALAFSTGDSPGDREYFNQMYSLVRVSITSNSNVFRKSSAHPDYKTFMDQRIGSAAPEYADYLKLIYYQVFSGGDYRSRDALVAMRGWISQKTLTTLPYHKLHRIFSNSYSNLFIQPGRSIIQLQPNSRLRERIDNIGLFTASRLYESYKPYANSKYWLPEAQNFYTYRDIYSRAVCADNLLDEVGRQALAEITAAWESGSISHAEALSRVEKLDTEPTKADLKTFIGNLQQLQGNFKEAERQYWLAHEACAYYNRAHGGLSRLRAAKANQTLPNHDKLTTTFLAKVPAEPTKIQNYVSNYNRLNLEQRNILLASLGLFVPYIDFLADNGYRLYLKHTYQRLSELPGLEGRAAERVPEFDQRLRDDIRGISTEKVIVADLLEMQEVPYGGANVPVHEAAHQFHRATSENIKQCITELFNAAKARNNGKGFFSVGYAATNEREYFAMGVEHYVIPEGSPSTRGINRGWYLNNDSRLFLLIQKIEEATGDQAKVAAISCPTATDPVPLSQPQRDITASVLKGSDGQGYFLSAAMDPEIENAFVCFAPEVDCRNGEAEVLKLTHADFVGATSFFIYPHDLKLEKGKAKHATILGKESDSARYTHAIPVSATAK